ncbi:Type 1 glutamine amidotransferase-like domain-containing protein [Patescibacteria group bacterium]|nr:Type 1 glutamine amidotransferase-like domain-containing protein [Patescibacteria group bacterium]
MKNTKLLLTSAGFLNKEISNLFLKELSKEPNKSKVFMVTGARTKEEEYYIQESKQELINLGFKDIFVFNLDRKILLDEVKDCDVIYVCGGNTYYILKRFRETGLDKIVIELVNQGKIYIGVSAGSVMAGPNIEIAGWGEDGDKNDVNLKDLTGFNFTNIAVFPHFEEKNRQEVKEFKKKVNYPVIELTDNQAVFVKGKNYIIIGE